MACLNKRVIHLIILIIFYSISSPLLGQNLLPTVNSKNKSFRAVFYNVENLIDIYDDSLTLDDEFLPYGPKGWNYKKFRQKVNYTAKTIIASGNWNPPAIIGVCEIENLYVLKELATNSPQEQLNYQIIHFNSKDQRGIDVALLYKAEFFKVIHAEPVPITFSKNIGKTSRDILYVKGTLTSSDTLHVFVNHWPSRYSGKLASEDHRIDAAIALKQKVDSILQSTFCPNVLIMGDFNDEPQNTSLKTLVSTSLEKNTKDSLVNLMKKWESTDSPGTLKFQGNWFVFDQIIVSSSLTNPQNQLSINKYGVFAPEWLWEDDKAYLGRKPFRTYGFEVQESQNGLQFKPIGFVSGSKNLKGESSYSFRDYQFHESSYYRLRQVDFDGNFDFSKVVFLSNNSPFILPAQVFPNPVKDKLNFDKAYYQFSSDKQIQPNLSNAQGKILFSDYGSLSELNRSLNQIVSELEQGSYFINMYINENSRSLKIIKN